MPRDEKFDGTLAWLRDPYRFIRRRCAALGSDVFETRLALKPTICMSGPSAAAVFYDNRLFMRSGAAPTPVQTTLFGVGGVQGLDGEAHRHRKALFMSLMTSERIEALASLAALELLRAAAHWQSLPRVVLADAFADVMARAACVWAGIALDPADATRRMDDLKAMFDGAGAIGTRHLHSKLARRRGERWIGRVVDNIRTGSLAPPVDSAVRAVAEYRDARGRLLDSRVAAVEILNLLRPIAAISVFLTFVAHALERYPAYREELEANTPNRIAPFIQEVRRFYPFFPAVAARVTRDFEWRGYRFRRGRRALLDLFGTNRDPRMWESPDQFKPARFAHWDGSPFSFIPQGGGSFDLGHRCAGEWITIAVMEAATEVLLREIDYAVPDQDSSIDFSRLPALPRSGLVIHGVRLRSKQ